MEKFPNNDHINGQLDAAELQYLQLKDKYPNNNDINFWLGYLYFQKNDFLNAKKYIEIFLSKEKNTKAYNLLGLIYKNLNEFDNAKNAFLLALKINPNYIDAKFNYATLLVENNFYDEAIKILDLIVEENSFDTDALFLLGFCYQQLKNYNLALHFYLNALAANCNKPELYYNISTIYLENNQPDKVLEFISDGLKLYPNNDDLMLAYALFFEKTNDKNTFEKILLDLSNKEVNNFLPYLKLADFYKDLFILDKSEYYYTKAFNLSPNNQNILLNYGVLKYIIGQFEAAETLFKMVLKIDPNNLSALNNLANTYLELNNFNETEKIYKEIINKYKDSYFEQFNYGLTLLLLSNFEKGFYYYEKRLHLDEYKRDIPNKTRWNGEDLTNKNLFIYGEQGIGDIIMFSRFLTIIKNKYNCNIIFECRAEVLDLMQINFPFLTTIKRGDDLDTDTFDYFTSLLSLPYILKIKDKAEINNNPYLLPHENLLEKWAKYFAVEKSFKVGIVWKGNPHPIIHRKRHTELKYFLPLTKIPNVKLYSLQFGENYSEELKQNNITELVYNFNETAAIIKNLDLVITIDTSIVHLAGALGVETWVLLTKVPDWRWELDTKTSYWYKTVTLFRQTQYNNWQQVFDNIYSELIKKISLPQKDKLNINELKNKAFELLEKNDFLNAVNLYNQLVLINPNDAENYIWLGYAYYNLKDFQNSTKNFKSALDKLGTLPKEIYTFYLNGLLNIANYNLGINETENALKQYPNEIEFYNIMGLFLLKLNNVSQAEKYFNKALSLNSSYTPAIVNIANYYLENKDFAKSLQIAESYLNQIENKEPLLYIIGNAYLGLNNPEKAIEHYKQISNNFKEHQFFNNYGIALQRVHNYVYAELYFLKALELTNDNYGYWANLGNNYALTYQFSKAIECYNKGLEFSKGDKKLLSMIGLTHLLTENFTEGWSYFEHSLTFQVPFSYISNCKEYNGEELSGKTIIVYSEHGLGDTIQFLRYLPLLKEKGCEIIFEFQQELKPLLFYPNGYYQPLTRGEYDVKDLKADYYISLLKLPRIFCTNIANIPKLAPILNINLKLIEIYDKLLIKNKKRIGLVWAGNPIHPNDHNRSLSLDYLQLLFNIPQNHYYLLQKSDTKLKLPAEFNRFDNITDLSNELTTLEETAAIIKNLDLVITVDTMIAHLAATLNVKTFLLLPYLPDWRWLLNRNDSVWYPSITIFRQNTPGDWSYPLEQIYNTICLTINAQNTKEKIEQLIKNNQFDEAIHLLEDENLTNLDKAFLLNTIAIVFINSKDYETAIKILDSAYNLDKTYYEIPYNLGYCNHILNKIEEANNYYKIALSLHPIHINSLNNSGIIERDLGNLDNSKILFKKAIKLAFNKPFLHNNLGTSIEAEGNNNLAIEEFNIALSINPNFIDALINISNVYHFTNRSNIALDIINKAFAIAPDNPSVRFNRSLTLLRLGKLKEGFTEYEYRTKRPDYPKYKFTKPRLMDLQSVKNKIILVYDEQGYGDTIQFCRYIKNLKNLGGYIKLLCHNPLKELMQGCLGVDEVIGRNSLNDTDIKYDYHIPLLSLGMFFEDTLENIKVDVPYIVVDHKTKEKWANEISKNSKLKIGFVWKGKQTQGNTHRSCKLNHFLLIFSNLVNFYSLQLDLTTEEKELLEQNNIVNFGDRIKTFNDTAAIISNLDLVISIDTSVAHLSCALGKPTWILLSTKCDWRWHDFRGDSPWYPTAKLFRQKEFNNWITVFTEVEKELKKIIN